MAWHLWRSRGSSIFEQRVISGLLRGPEITSAALSHDFIPGSSFQRGGGSMATFLSSEGREVEHCHVRSNPDSPCSSREWTIEEKQQKREELAAMFPDVDEFRVPSRKYNCFGYAYTRAHGWFSDADIFIADDFSVVPMEEPQLRDVLVYEDDEGEITHSAVVWEVAGGVITKVRSKWGKMAAVE